MLLMMCYSSPSLAVEVPVYGNWCGPGVPSPGQPPTRDEIDQACKLHDGAYGRRPGSSADRELANTVAGILHRGHQWVRRNTGGIDYNVELTDHQFIVAAAIVANFTQQQNFTVLFDLFNGDVRAVVKFATSGSARTVVLPAAATNALATRVASKLDTPLLEPYLEVSKVQVELIIRAADVADKTVDSIIHAAEFIGDTIAPPPLPTDIDDVGVEDVISIVSPAYSIIKKLLPE